MEQEQAAQEASAHFPLLNQSFVCWAWLAEPGLGSAQLQGLDIIL